MIRLSDKKIKVCGMREQENIQAICTLEPDFIGYIFYPASPRYVGDQPDPEIFTIVQSQIIKTAVFVNEGFEKIMEIVARFGIRAVQLHGSEDPELCLRIKEREIIVIKALSAKLISDSAHLNNYSDSVDYFLFDTPTKAHGGSGTKFDWDLLEEYSLENGFFISGGIGPGDDEYLRNITNNKLIGIDINSRFELGPGMKDAAAVEKFINEIRKDK